MKEKDTQPIPNKPSKEQEYLDGWKRARADLENMKKRMADSLASQQGAMKKDIAYSLVALADNFRSLAEHVPNASDPWAAGVLHVARQFEQTLSEFGVEVIADVGKEFNPAFHEAIEEVEKEGEKPGMIVELVQAGYKIGDSVIRPAKVTVVRSSPTEIGDPDEGVDGEQPDGGPAPYASLRVNPNPRQPGGQALPE